MKVRVDLDLSKEPEVKVGMHQRSVLSIFLFTVMVDVATELAREDVLSDLLCTDNLFRITEAIEGQRNKIRKWKKAFKSKDLKVNLEKQHDGQWRHDNEWPV